MKFSEFARKHRIRVFAGLWLTGVVFTIWSELTQADGLLYQVIGLSIWIFGMWFVLINLPDHLQFWRSQHK
ncbi:MAG: hypothetical protein AAFV33_00815 [Chloroflexota bacterium]